MSAALLLHATFALGGGLGAVARHALGQRVAHRFPLATLLVNVLGSFLLGAGLAALGGTGGDAVLSRQLLAGFCGGFTTFSSFARQSLELRREHTVLHAALNVALNLGLCIAALRLGAAVFRPG